MRRIDVNIQHGHKIKQTEGTLESETDTNLRSLCGRVCRITHVYYYAQVLVSQLPFLANKNAELDVSLLFWPVNCIKIEGGMLSCGPTDYSLYCDCATWLPKRNRKHPEKPTS